MCNRDPRPCLNRDPRPCLSQLPLHEDFGSAGQWATRSFVRDSLAGVFPDQEEKIRHEESMLAKLSSDSAISMASFDSTAVAICLSLCLALQENS